MRSRAKRRARRKEPGSRGGQRLHCTPPSAAAALACFVCAPPVRLHHIYMPLRPQTTRLSEKLNITQVAAQPSCTMKGSPWRCFVVVLLLWGCLCCGLRWRGRAVVGSAHGGRRRRRAEAGVGRRAAFCALLRGARGTCSGYGGCFGVGTGSTTTSAAWRMGGGLLLLRRKPSAAAAAAAHAAAAAPRGAGRGEHRCCHRCCSPPLGHVHPTHARSMRRSPITSQQRVRERLIATGELLPSKRRTESSTQSSAPRPS